MLESCKVLKYSVPILLHFVNRAIDRITENPLISIVAGVVELADAPDSKSGGGNSVWVQLPPPAPYKSMSYDVSCFS
jgi:hypothetical protein